MFKKRGKKAQEVSSTTILTIFWVIVAIFALIVIPAYAAGKGKNTLLEKQYLARDLALLIDVIYASPGNLTYTYPLDIAKFNFGISFFENKVSVYDKGKPATSVSFPFLNATFINFSYKEISLDEGEQLIFVKENNNIKVDKK